MLCEMQSVPSRIWTRDAMLISYDDNHYTTLAYNAVQRNAKSQKKKNCNLEKRLESNVENSYEPKQIFANIGFK